MELHRPLTSIARAGLIVFMALTANAARAVSCDEIVGMVSVNVPEDIVIQTIKDSGAALTDADVACLQKANVPQRVIDQAQAMVPKTEAVIGTSTGKKAEEKSGMSEDEDILGSKSGKSKNQGAAEEAVVESGGLPPKLQDAIQNYKANQPLKASNTLFEMLEEGAYPEYENAIYYYLAGSLFKLQMWHTSQYYYLKVAKAGPTTTYFNYALPQLIKIAQQTGDDAELLKLVDNIPPDAFPRAAKSQLSYLMGIQRYEKEDLAGASKYFADVSAKSAQYYKAKYFEGVILNKQDKKKLAARAFVEVYQANVEVSPEDAAAVDRLKELSLMNVARIYYGIEEYKKSSEYYDSVSHDSEFWPEALFENGWSYFMQNDLNASLGKILTMQSPFFRTDQFMPEGEILKALTFFNLCEYSEVERLLLRFEDQYRPMADEMKGFVQGYATTEGKQMADQAFDYYFGGKAVDSVLPKSLFTRIFRNQDLKALVHDMDMMDDELKLIDAQKEDWRSSVGVKLKEIIEKDRQRYKRRAGLLFLSEMARTYGYLQDLLTQSEIIRFEVVDAQRVDYQYKMQNTELKDSSGNLDVDFATAKDVIYWPFNNEFWQDELGYYQFTEQSSCN